MPRACPHSMRLLTSSKCSFKGWNCHAVIVKSGDDCRQELLAMQLIEAFQRAFDVESLPLWLKPYKVLPTSNQTALIELLPDTMSVHSIKRCLPPGSSLADHFFRMFPKGTQECEAAQRSFAQSLAAYSLICYLLQVKDRHNANIMLDQKVGRILLAPDKTCEACSKSGIGSSCHGVCGERSCSCRAT